MADRYAYIPLIGIFVMIAWASTIGGGESSPHGLAGNPAIVRVAGFRPRHFSADKILVSDYDLWSHTLAVTERNPFAHFALAAALLSDPNRQ